MPADPDRPDRFCRSRAKAFLGAIAAVLIAGSMAWAGSAVASGSAGGGVWFTAAQSAGGSGGQSGNSVAVSSNGTQIITGSFGGTATFPTGPGTDDSITLTSSRVNFTDIFVAALNADDSYFAWAVSAGGTGNNVGNSVAVTTDDTPIITGSFEDTAYFPTGRPAPDDSIALSSSGNEDIFVAALNADDSYFAWAVRAGGTGFDSGSSVAVISDDTPIITGYFTGTATFPTGPGTLIALTSSGGDDIFVAALNADDSYFAWAVRAGGAGNDYGNSVAVMVVAIRRQRPSAVLHWLFAVR